MEQFIKDKIEEIAFSRVNNDDLLWTDKILDSITLVELIVEIESEYNIKVPMNEVVVENFETVDLIIKYIESKKA
ncbi:MAG: acyl carrier protein [Fluviicola sp.]|jgi:acyl carrier protein|nr:acyl carrier protein [Fluviicola sp.]